MYLCNIYACQEILRGDSLGGARCLWPTVSDPTRPRDRRAASRGIAPKHPEMLPPLEAALLPLLAVREPHGQARPPPQLTSNAPRPN
jgi:hypothetical protein